MKKFFLSAAVACVALASCVKNEPVNLGSDNNGVEITFASPVLTPNVKSATEFEGEFPTDQKIGVWAYYYVNSANAEDAAVYTKFTEGTLFMGKDQGGLPLQYSESEGMKTWKHATNKYYWPKNGSLTFTAYAPYTAANALLAKTTDSGVTFTNYQVSEDPAEQEDLLYSVRAYNKTAVDADPAGEYKGVALEFKHALTSIKFQVKAAGDYSTTKLTVKKIELLNVKSKGSFDQSLEDANNSNPDKGQWTLSSDPADVKTYSPTLFNDEIELTTAFKYVHNGDDLPAAAANGKRTTDLILLPHQSLEDLKLRVTFDYKNDQMTAPISQVITKPLSTDTVTAWEQGKRYTYSIAVALDEIYFAPSVSDWEDKSAVVQNL